MRRLSLGVILSLLALGAAVDAIDLWRPIDGSSRELFRECDMGGIARNYAREGMHLLYPRIDWRGDGPGYVEMEFPIYPYAIAIGYRALGIHAQIGRVITYAVSLVTLGLFIALATYLLPPVGAVTATLFFIIDPLTVRLANAIQPEPLMLLGYIGAVYTYLRWLDEDTWWWYGWALFLTSLAVLAKAPAAHVGLVFLALTVWRRGWRAFLRPRLWILGIAALVPPALWYWHAHQFYLTYGNSLGASNHQHFTGLKVLTESRYVTGIARIEMSLVWMSSGLLAVAMALALGLRSRAFTCGLLWYAAILIYYLLIAGTSAETWASYYHIVSVPPAALLIGAAAAAVVERLRSRQAPRLAVPRLAWAMVVLLCVAAVQQVLRPGTPIAPLGVAALVGALVLIARRAAGAAALAALACLTMLAPVSALRQTVSEIHPHRFEPQYETAKAFAPLIPPGVLIAVSGEACVSKDESAYNSPWYLYWTDHKGFTPCVQDHTIPVVRALEARGARYFIADRAALAAQPGFEAEMRRAFTVESETSEAVLFKLD